MNNITSKIISYLAKNPGKLFLLDSFGAFITSFILFFVLRSFSTFFGMPESPLIFLSAIGACYCIYSAVCFVFVASHHAAFITGISFANLLYCVLTAALLIYYHNSITVFGIAYFSGEIAVVCTLVYIELRVAGIIRNNLTLHHQHSNTTSS